MKRFRFALQPVAVLRAHQEARAREVFGAAAQATDRAEQALAATRARVTRFEAELSAGRSGHFSAGAQAQVLAAYVRERAAEEEASRAVAAARATMEQRRSEYFEAHRKVEVVKRLEVKARATHRAEVGREEQAEFDDFASRRATRRPLLQA